MSRLEKLDTSVGVVLVAAFFVSPILGEPFVIGAACVAIAWFLAGEMTAKVCRGKRDGIWCEGFDAGKDEQRKLALIKHYHDVEDHGYTWIDWKWPEWSPYAEPPTRPGDSVLITGFEEFRFTAWEKRFECEPPAVFDHQGRG